MTVNSEIVEQGDIDQAQAFITALGTLEAGRFAALIADLEASGPYTSFTAMADMLYLLANVRFAIADAVNAANAGDLTATDFQEGGLIYLVGEALKALPEGTTISGEVVDGDDVDAALALFNAMDDNGQNVILAAINNQNFTSFSELIAAAMAAYEGLPVHNVTRQIRYLHIQDAIDTAEEDNTIEVAEGSYYENIVIGVPGLILVSDSNAVIDGNDSGIVVTIESNGAKLQGFTIQNGGQTDPDTEAGILIFNQEFDITGVAVENCTVQNNATGIGIIRGTNNTIQDNIIKDNLYSVGIANLTETLPSTNNLVLNNDIFNTAVGVYVDKYCSGNQITDNDIYEYTDNGIYLWATQNNIVADNVLTGNGTAGSNGIHLAWGSGHAITGNTISGNENGINIRKRVYDGNLIEFNSIVDNSGYGLIFHDLELPGGADEVIDATCNYWGTEDEAYEYPAIEAMISGEVVFEPWLIEVAGVMVCDGKRSTYEFVYEVPDSIVEGVEVVVPVRFHTLVEGSEGYEFARFGFYAEGPGNVTFIASDNGTTYEFINEGYWGPASGFPIPAYYNEVTEWTLIFSLGGEYSINFYCFETGKEDDPFASGEQVVYVGSEVPRNVQIQLTDTEVILSWDAALGATSYRVYSSTDPYGEYVEDTTGEFDGTTWTAPRPEGLMKFYRITALSE